MAMGRSRDLLLLIPFLLVTISEGGVASTGHHMGMTFIRASCRSTLYPDLCVRTLSLYAPTIRRSSRNLARAALSISLRHTRSTCAFVDRVTGAKEKTTKNRAVSGAVRDCIETMSDSVDRIRQSIGQMGHMGRKGTPAFWYHISNVQTWVSAALTDESTCLDSFTAAGGGGVDPRVRDAIRRRIVRVAQVTSNALALVNKVAKGRY